MKTYSTYKDSEIEWIGAIPDHWDRTALKRAVKIKITDGPHETPEFLDHGIPFISAEGVKNGKVNFNYKRGHISKEVHELYSKKCKPKKGDVFIVKSGSTTGKVAYVDTDIEFNIWSPIALVRPKDEFSGKYLFYFCDSDCFQKQVQLFWSFGTQPNIGMGVLENLYVAFPSLKEQTAIANFLDYKTAQIDGSIEKRRELIELLKEHRAAIINESVTKGTNPEVPLRDSGIEWIGEIPEHWGIKKVKHITTKIGSGVTPRGGAETYLTEGVLLLRSQNIYFDGLRLNDVACISEDVHDSMSNSKVYEGDVLLNITGGSIGRCYFIDKSVGEANVNQHVCIVRPDSGQVETEYLYYYLRSNLGQEQILLCQTGANREGLNFEQLKQFIFPYPQISEQQQIVEFIKAETTRIDEEIQATQKEIDLLEEYRQSLIAEAVTGKIDVRNYPLTN